MLQVSVEEHGNGDVKVESVLTEVFGVPGNQTDTGHCNIVREEELLTLLATPQEPDFGTSVDDLPPSASTSMMKQYYSFTR